MWHSYSTLFLDSQESFWSGVQQPGTIINKTHNTMKNKLFYEVPEAELIEVKFEENILSELSTDGSSIESGTVNDQSNSQNSIWGWYE